MFTTTLKVLGCEIDQQLIQRWFKDGNGLGWLYNKGFTNIWKESNKRNSEIFKS